MITRVEGLLADGRRIDLPLRVETAGISRAEIEARIPQITADPSLLAIRVRRVDVPPSGGAGAAAGVAGPRSDAACRRSRWPDPFGRTRDAGRCPREDAAVDGLLVHAAWFRSRGSRYCGRCCTCS